MTDNRPPTLPRDVRVTLKDLDDIVHRAQSLAKILPDLHVLAYERQVSGEPVRATRSVWYLDEQGLGAAKDALRELMAERGSSSAKALAGALAEHLERCQSLFRGPGADTSLRGTLLGDDRGNGAQRELTEALKAQQRRGERGEYAPSRSEPQPKRVPGR